MKKIADLSFHIEVGMPFFPSGKHTPFEFSETCTIESAGREIRKFIIGTHCGTHIDAFRHFIPGGLSIDELPLNRVAGEALLVNLAPLPPQTVIEIDDIANKMKSKKIEKLIIRSDWSKFWKTDQYFKNWPRISQKCAEFIIEKGIKLLGLDFPSPDPAYKGENEEDSPIHKLLFKNDVILVEYLNNLAELGEGKIFFTAIPLKLKGFDGSPVRATGWKI